MTWSSKRRLNPAEAIRVGRGAVHVYRSSEDPAARGARAAGRAPAFGPLAVRVLGERVHYQAARSQAVPPPGQPSDDDAKVKGGPFDRIPRRHGAMLALVILGIGLLLGVVLGVRELNRTGWKVGASADAFSRAQPIVAPKPAPAQSATPAPPATPPIVTPLPAPTPRPTPAAGEPAHLDEAAAPPARAERESTSGDLRSREGAADGQAQPANAQAATSGNLKSRRPHGRKRAAVGAQLESETAPATTGEVAAPAPIEDPGRIAPPKELPPPPEHRVPADPTDTDPFQP